MRGAEAGPRRVRAIQDAFMHAPATAVQMSRTASIAAAISAISVVGMGISLSIPLLSLEME